MASGKRRWAERRGRWAEHYAALWLRAKGYDIVARRVKLPLGEIDLVARRRGVLAFIEVKQRQTLEDALTAVTGSAWQRIARASDLWASRNPRFAGFDWRYDLIAITPRHLPKHYKDYWRP